MNKGVAERSKPTGEPVDASVIRRAIDAAREVIGRKDRTGIPPELTDDAALLVPSLQDRLIATAPDRVRQTLDACNAYLDYAEQYASKNPGPAKEALDRAGYLTFELRKDSAEKEGVAQLYDRFLKIAVNPPFNHAELTYLWAVRLRSLDRLPEALAM